jgi:pantothenate kinase
MNKQENKYQKLWSSNPYGISYRYIYIYINTKPNIPKIIGISGKAYSGKTTLARFFIEKIDIMLKNHLRIKIGGLYL